ncbi:MAG TPA: hypothetical protein DCZ82_01560 [Candidatus Levybacteria bacterium]|nr:hypothetical protein [Candidatus Levybacteria bacterium]
MKAESKKLFSFLMGATSETEIEGILGKFSLLREENWRLYGDRELNQNIIDNQQGDPIAALVEKPINSIDALLLLECKKRGVDPESPLAPQSMKEALKEFYGVDLDRFVDLSAEQRRSLAKNIFIIAEGSKETPSIIVVDRGEGQHPSDFPRTFLSLEGKLKNTIHFVQGQYSMGGTGVLRFCGEKKYQLILSRKNRALLRNGQKDEWGFALVRRHITEGTKFKTEWYEYLVDSDHEVFRFSGQPLELIAGEPPFDFGTYVKMFNYMLGRGLSSVITLDLWRALNRRLFMPVIPLIVFETRPEYKGKSPQKLMLGNKHRVLIDERDSLEDQFSIPMDMGPFGMRKLWIVVFKQPVKTDEFTTYRDAVFLTINGQTLGTWDRSLFGSENARLHYLRNYLLVQVDLTDVDTHIRTNLFMPSRDRIAEGSPYAQKLKERIIYELKNCERLKKLNETRRDQRVGMVDKDDEQMFKEFLQELLIKNRSLADLLPFGKKIKISSAIGRITREKTPFIGKYIPTFLKVQKSKDGETVKKILPINSYIQVRLETDAQNDYLDREKDGGKLFISPSVKVLSGGYLNDGLIPFRVSPQKNAKVGENCEVEIELTRPYDGSLRANFQVEYSAPTEKMTRPPGKRVKKEETFDIPMPHAVFRKDWSKYNWTGEDIVEIGEIEKEGEKVLDVWLNMDADVLINFLRSKSGLTEEKQLAVKRFYKAGIHLHSLILYHEFKDRADKGELVAKIMKGVSKVILFLGDESVLKAIED